MIGRKREVRMMVDTVDTGKVRTSRKLPGLAANPGRGVRAMQTKVVAMDDAQTNRSSGEVARAANDTNHIPVTFWGSDGTCYEGKSPHVTGEVIFVESKQLVPLETEVTIRVASPSEGMVNQGVVTGTVIWQCPSSDLFKNLQGFGVCFQSRWPQPPGSTGSAGPREVV
jgi:hypothetical protein